MTSSVKSRPKFSIVEGGSFSKEKQEKIYEDFMEDYLSSDIKKSEMLEKYELSENQYIHLKNRVAEETGVNRKASKTTGICAWQHKSRYIDYMTKANKFRVSKVIIGKKHHFGMYDDFKTAEYVRDTLEENNWSQETYEKLRYEIFGEEDNPLDLKDIYDDFKRDFLNGESIRWLVKKYGISNNTYNTLSKMVRSETGLLRKPQLHIKVMRRHERDLFKQG